MKKLSKVLCLAAIFSGIIFRCCISIDERISRREDAWAKLHEGITQDIPSPKVSDAD